MGCRIQNLSSVISLRKPLKNKMKKISITIIILIGLSNLTYAQDYVQLKNEAEQRIVELDKLDTKTRITLSNAKRSGSEEIITEAREALKRIEKYIKEERALIESYDLELGINKKSLSELKRERNILLYEIKTYEELGNSEKVSIRKNKIKAIDKLIENGNNGVKGNLEKFIERSINHIKFSYELKKTLK
jgi:hypothetical protein